MKRSILLWICVPLMSALYQLFIKLGAQDMNGMALSMQWIARMATSPWIDMALVCEIIAFVAWLKILSEHNLSKAFPLTSASYLLVLILSHFVLYEPISPLQIIGSMLILCGIWLIGTNNPASDTPVSSNELP